jgi:hypothetical protein
MSYRHFSLSCRCGQPPARIEEVGVTDDHELVIHWWCEDCRKVVWASKSLSDCWRECPKTDERPDFDAEFLHSIGVRPA